MLLCVTFYLYSCSRGGDQLQQICCNPATCSANQFLSSAWLNILQNKQKIQKYINSKIKIITYKIHKILVQIHVQIHIRIHKTFSRRNILFSPSVLLGITSPPHLLLQYRTSIFSCFIICFPCHRVWSQLLWPKVSIIFRSALYCNFFGRHTLVFVRQKALYNLKIHLYFCFVFLRRLWLTGVNWTL